MSALATERLLRAAMAAEANRALRPELQRRRAAHQLRTYKRRADVLERAKQRREQVEFRRLSRKTHQRAVALAKELARARRKADALERRKIRLELVAFREDQRAQRKRDKELEKLVRQQERDASRKTWGTGGTFSLDATLPAGVDDWYTLRADASPSVEAIVVGESGCQAPDVEPDILALYETPEVVEDLELLSDKARLLGGSLEWYLVEYVGLRSDDASRIISVSDSIRRGVRKGLPDLPAPRATPSFGAFSSRLSHGLGSGRRHLAPAGKRTGRKPKKVHDLKDAY